VLLCQSSKFGRSNEGKIGRVKEKDRPAILGELVLQTKIAEFVLRRIVSGEFEIRNFLAELKFLGHFTWSPSSQGSCALEYSHLFALIILFQELRKTQGLEMTNRRYPTSLEGAQGGLYPGENESGRGRKLGGED
jgi:hypothetical protein